MLVLCKGCGLVLRLTDQPKTPWPNPAVCVACLGDVVPLAAGAAA